MIRIENVTHYYKNSNCPVVEDIAFSITKGECVALTGPSGIGKSTIATIIAGFIKPSIGNIFINNENVTGKPSKKIMLINQESDLFPWQTVDKHILFALSHTDLNMEDKLRVKNNLLSLVHLKGHEKRYPHELSGGMKKRLSLVRALAVNPMLLILDEPFSSLDLSLKENLYANLKEIWNHKETTILLITHDLKDVKNLAQRNIMLKEHKPTSIKKIINMPLTQNPVLTEFPNRI